MRTRQTLNLGRERFRVGPWHADSSVAHLSLLPDRPRPTLDGVLQCVSQLREQGYTSVITAALHPDETDAFVMAGFGEHDRLTVLGHDLRNLDRPRPTTPHIRLRRGRPTDRPVALAIDARAFPGPWRLDEGGLDDALTATPHRRFRLAAGPTGTVGYAVTGRAGRQAFLQRLATDPSAAGRGVGSALVIDALRWAVRRHASRVLVNTQTGNERALALYRRLGFHPTPTDLVVLTRPLT